MTMLKSVYLDHRYEGTLTNPEKDDLLNIANTGQIFSMDKARGILEYYYGYEFEELINREAELQKFDGPAEEKNEAIVIVSPNPSKGVFEIGLKDDNGSIRIIQIFDRVGKMVFDKNYETEVKTVTVKMDAPKAGTYIFKVITSGGKTGSGNLVIE